MSTRVQHVESATNAQTDASGNLTLTISAATAGHVIVYWANSDATIATPTGATAIDSQVNGNGAYTWSKVAAGGETSVTFHAVSGTIETITCGIVEVSGVDNSAVHAHNAVYASGQDVGSPPASITTTLAAYVLGFGFSHSLVSDPASPTWSSVLTNFADIGSDTGADSGHYCHAFVGDASAVAASTYTLNAAWTPSTGFDRNTFLVAFAELGSGVAAGNAAGTGSAKTVASITVAPVVGIATGTGISQPPSVVTFTGTGVPGGLAAGTGSANAPTVILGPSAGRAGGVGVAGDVGIIFSGPVAGAGIAWAVTPTVAPNAITAAGAGLALGSAATDAPNVSIAAGTGVAYVPTFTFGTADVTVNPQIARGNGTAFQPAGTQVSFGPTVAAAIGVARQPIAAPSPNAARATGTGSAFGLVSTTTISTAAGVGRAYDASGAHSPFVFTLNTFTYTTPTGFDVPSIDAKDHGTPYRLFRHYGLRARGVNVWRLVDGTFTVNQPYPLVSVQDAATQTIDAPATYIDVFWGGHVYKNVSALDALALNAAGLGTLGVDLIVNEPELLTSEGVALFVQDAGIDIGVLISATV